MLKRPKRAHLLTAIVVVGLACGAVLPTSSAVANGMRVPHLKVHIPMPGWTYVAPMFQKLCCQVAATGRDGRIYVVGGEVSGVSYADMPILQIYDPRTNIWKRAMHPPRAFYGPAGAMGLDGRLYVINGNPYDPYMAAYTPQSNSWARRTPPHISRLLGAAATGPDGRIYAIGGNGESSVEAYDPKFNTWSFVAPLLEAQAPMAATTGADGRIYVTDGAGKLQVYDTTANTWTMLAPMPHPRFYQMMATGADSRIYAIGGCAKFGCDVEKWHETTTIAEVDAYDPIANTWTTAMPLNTQRATPAVTTGLDGRIYVMGGLVSANHYWVSMAQTTEAYGPVIQLSATTARLGATVVVTGTNFTPDTSIKVYWGTMRPKILLAQGLSDAQGICQGITVTLPTWASVGAHRITVLDTASQYPVNTDIVVTGS